jgi:hypothetical protein
MVNPIVQIASLVIIPVTVIQHVLLVWLVNTRIKIFNCQLNRVQIVPAADILPRSVCPVHWDAMLVPLENIPTKKA